MCSIPGRIRKLALAVAAAMAGVGLGGGALAGETVSIEASVDWVTAYLWHGMRITNNPVIQPSVTVSAYGISLNTWGSIDVTDVNEDNGEDYRLQEVDYTVSYSYSPMEGLDLEGGLACYTFSGFDSTREVFLTATLSKVPLSPSLSAYYDVDEANGFYVNAGVEHGFEITKKLGLTLAGGVGWGSSKYHEYYFGDTAHDALSDAQVTATLSYAFTDYLSLSVYGGYAALINSEVRDLGDETYGNADTPFGGISIGLSF